MRLSACNGRGRMGGAEKNPNTLLSCMHGGGDDISHEMLVINIAPWPSMLTSTSFLGGPEGRGRVGRGWPWGHPLPTLPSARECWRPHCIGLRRPRTSPRRMWPAREPLGNEVINVATNTPVRPGVLVEGGPRATLYRHARDGDPRRRPDLCTVLRSPLRD